MGAGTVGAETTGMATVLHCEMSVESDPKRTIKLAFCYDPEPNGGDWLEQQMAAELQKHFSLLLESARTGQPLPVSASGPVAVTGPG